MFRMVPRQPYSAACSGNTVVMRPITSEVIGIQVTSIIEDGKMSQQAEETFPPLPGETAFISIPSDAELAARHYAVSLVAECVNDTKEWAFALTQARRILDFLLGREPEPKAAPATFRPGAAPRS